MVGPREAVDGAARRGWRLWTCGGDEGSSRLRRPQAWLQRMPASLGLDSSLVLLLRRQRIGHQRAAAQGLYVSCDHKVAEEAGVGGAHGVGEEADVGGGGQQIALLR